MTASGALWLVDEVEPARARPEPKIFVRSLATPPGLPWDQARAAELEARHGAPLPLTEVMYRLRRLEGWKPGQPGRFAAFYVLAAEVGDRLEATVEVDGQLNPVLFLSRAEQARRARRMAVAATAAGLLSLIVVVAVGSAIAKRAEATAQLNLLEQRSLVTTRAAEKVRAQQRQAAALDALPDRGAPLSDVLGDISWASGAKAPEAVVQALHWDHGLMALETRGQASPFRPDAERRIERAAKPVRPGIWLWGVAPRDLQRNTVRNAVPLASGDPDGR